MAATITAKMILHFDTREAMLDLQFEGFPEVEPKNWEVQKAFITDVWIMTMKEIIQKVEEEHPELKTATTQ